MDRWEGGWCYGMREGIWNMYISWAGVIRVRGKWEVVGGGWWNGLEWTDVYENNRFVILGELRI